MVVDLAIEDDGDGSILVPHRLVAAGDIQDRQPAMTQVYTALRVDVVAGAVGPPMDQRSGHPLKDGSIALPGEARQTAHGQSRFSKFIRRPTT